MSFISRARISGAAMAVFAAVAPLSEAWSRCVTAVGDYPEAKIEEITKAAHQRGVPAGTWSKPDGGFFTDATVDRALVGVYSFATAVEQCERQHQATANQNPGKQTSTGLTCDGWNVFVITGDEHGLECK